MVVLVAGLYLAGCTKHTVKSGTGLYSVKQYHSYIINSGGDTGKLADATISIAELPNNYLSWNLITFHLNYNSDSVKVFTKDSAIGGVTQTIYLLQYTAQPDQVTVYDYLNSKYWKSY